MKCMINDIIKASISKNKQPDVIHRFLRMKHHINMDPKSVVSRISAIKNNFEQ
jgi:hypothetical protein